MPGTAKVLGFESDQYLFFFQTENILFQMKLSANYLSAYLLSALRMDFLLRDFFFNVACSV